MAVRIDPIKLICSLHVTQLDEKLDLEKMVVDGCGCENMCQKILVKWRMNVKRMMMKECGCNSNFFLLSFNVRSGNYSQLSRPINKSSSFKMPNMAVRIDPTKLKVVCMSYNWMTNLIWRRWLAKKYFFLLSLNVRSGQSREAIVR